MRPVQSPDQSEGRLQVAFEGVAAIRKINTERVAAAAISLGRDPHPYKCQFANDMLALFRDGWLAAAPRWIYTTEQRPQFVDSKFGVLRSAQVLATCADGEVRLVVMEADCEQPSGTWWRTCCSEGWRIAEPRAWMLAPVAAAL